MLDINMMLDNNFSTTDVLHSINSEFEYIFNDWVALASV